MIPALRMVLAIVFLAFVVPLGALLGFPWTVITGKVGFLYWMAMNITRAALWITGTRFETRGLEHLDPAGTYIFMSNHVSNLDPAILMPLIPRRTSVLVKKELWRVPILAHALDLGSLVPVERSNRESAIQSIKRAGEVMQQGINMMVYPEGTRSSDGRLLPFKKGPFHLAAETGIPIVPVTMLGTFEMMPKGAFASKGGRAAVVFHSPIQPSEFPTREALMQAVADAIRSALPPDSRS
jgi:1-acyl-sn-glycerol-3-phosphate acyltransferase